MIPTLPFLFGAMFTFPKFMGGKSGIDLPHMISYYGYQRKFRGRNFRVTDF